MRIVVNGKPVDVDEKTSIAGFLTSRRLDPALVAVEHNRKWLRRDEWPAVLLVEGDRLEVVKIMAGG